MNFTLTYSGTLKANGSPEHKHDVRREFHKQLHELWKHSLFADLTKPDDSLMKTVGNYKFLPLVASGRNEIAELQIIMLRPELASGYIVGQGGDIDNRLKTLFDSLRIPKEPNEIPISASPDEDESPFFCLLEDDVLITDLSVSTDRLLEPNTPKSTVKLIIRVQIKRVLRLGESMISRLGRI